MVADKDRIEVERIVNLVRGFGWEVVKQEFTEDRIILSLEKRRELEAVEMGAGPG